MNFEQIKNFGDLFDREDESSLWHLPDGQPLPDRVWKAKDLEDGRWLVMTWGETGGPVSGPPPIMQIRRAQGTWGPDPEEPSRWPKMDEMAECFELWPEGAAVQLMPYYVIGDMLPPVREGYCWLAAQLVGALHNTPAVNWCRIRGINVPILRADPNLSAKIAGEIHRA